jgi:hypothetical protein
MMMSLCSNLFKRASRSKGAQTKNRYSVKQGAESTSISAEGALDVSSDEALARSFATGGAKTQFKLKISEDQNVSASDDASEVGAIQFVMLARQGRELSDAEALALLEKRDDAPAEKKKARKTRDRADIVEEALNGASDNGASS